MRSDDGLFDLCRTSPPCSSSSPPEKRSTQYDLKTWNAGNKIETTVIAILKSNLTVVAINYVLLFHTYLLVPCQCCSPAAFSLGSPSLSHKKQWYKLGKSINRVVSYTGLFDDLQFHSYWSFFPHEDMFIGKQIFNISILCQCFFLYWNNWHVLIQVFDSWTGQYKWQGKCLSLGLCFYFDIKYQSKKMYVQKCEYFFLFALCTYIF